LRSAQMVDGNRSVDQPHDRPKRIRRSLRSPRIASTYWPPSKPRSRHEPGERRAPGPIERGYLLRVATRERYRRPGWVDRHIVEPTIRGLTRAGISVAGLHVLEVRGRRSGEVRRVAVAVLPFGGNRYLVAPRGETQWARNLRASGGGELVLGRRRESVRAVELPDSDKEPVLREYVRRWKLEVGRFFDGVGAGSTVDEFARIAPDHPVFRIEA
jgi:deazaflavin-dependent oxidoreductase (nitroreductase family)